MVIVYNFSTSTIATSEQVYLTTEPNYPTANSMGLLTANTRSSSSVASGTTISVNGISNAGGAYLLDVLKVKDASLPIGIPLTITITANLPMGVTMYYEINEQALELCASI
ncbi:MAG: hypothetical protein QXO23_07635 [Candidatus Methanomethyliaceae archaeon]